MTRSFTTAGLCAVTLLMGFIPSLWGDVAPTTAPSGAVVDQLIHQLGSDNAVDRDLAQRKLVDLGASAVPALKKAAESDEDPEIRSRASAAIIELNSPDANASAGPSMITLHTKNAPLQVVLNDLGNQAHAQLVDGGLLVGKHAQPVRMVDLDADKKPFWEVTRDLCSQLNYCPDLQSVGENQLRLFPAYRNWMDCRLPASNCGPVLDQCCRAVPDTNPGHDGAEKDQRSGVDKNRRSA